MNVEYLPENSSQKRDNYSYSIQYSKTDNTVQVKNKVVIDYLIFPKSRYDEWNDVIKSINKDYTESLLLKVK